MGAALSQLLCSPTAGQDRGQAVAPAKSGASLSESYCTLSATKRSSPSELATSNSTDFLPSFFS
jgi:hypothetical protein